MLESVLGTGILTLSKESGEFTSPEKLKNQVAMWLVCQQQCEKIFCQNMIILFCSRLDRKPKWEVSIPKEAKTFDEKIMMGKELSDLVQELLKVHHPTFNGYRLTFA